MEDRERLDGLRAEYEQLTEQHEDDDEEELPDDLDARLEGLEAEIDRVAEGQRSFAPEVMARGGVLVTLDPDGRARIERGFVRPEDEAEAESRTAQDRGDDDDGDSNEHDDDVDELNDHFEELAHLQRWLRIDHFDRRAANRELAQVASESVA